MGIKVLDWAIRVLMLGILLSLGTAMCYLLANEYQEWKESK